MKNTKITNKKYQNHCQSAAKQRNELGSLSYLSNTLFPTDQKVRVKLFRNILQISCTWCPLSDKRVHTGSIRSLLLVVRQKSVLQQKPAASVTLHVVGPFQQLAMADIRHNLYCRHIRASQYFLHANVYTDDVTYSLH